jgi:alpha-L-rhamnosidase
MQTWVDDDGIMFSQRQGKDGKPLKWWNLGDWCVPDGSVPDDVVHTFYFWRCADLTAQTAKALGKDGEARRYAGLAEKTRRAFHKRFYDKDNGTYGKAGGNIFALRMGVPDDQRKRVLASLRTDIAGNNGHLDTGIFGTQFFFEILSENGMHDLAYETMNKRTYPSYGHWLELGSTTTRERWDEGGSHNHPMFGGGIVWFYRKLAGMNADPTQPGYRHIIFRPQPVKDLDHVTYSNRTPFGTAGITWKNQRGKFQMDIRVPVGSRATIHVPAESVRSVSESGKKAGESEGVEFLRMESGYALFGVGSGGYSFEVE